MDYRGVYAYASVLQRLMHARAVAPEKWEGVPTLSTCLDARIVLRPSFAGVLSIDGQKESAASAAPLFQVSSADRDHSPFLDRPLTTSGSGVTALTAVWVALAMFDSAASNACFAALLKVS